MMKRIFIRSLGMVVLFSTGSALSQMLCPASFLQQQNAGAESIIIQNNTNISVGIYWISGNNLSPEVAPWIGAGYPGTPISTSYNSPTYIPSGAGVSANFAPACSLVCTIHKDRKGYPEPPPPATVTLGIVLPSPSRYDPLPAIYPVQTTLQAESSTIENEHCILGPLNIKVSSPNGPAPSFITVNSGNGTIIINQPPT
ncbi:MAG TPA: hypothetical protein VJB02_01290 [Coxiellaceae bacterium]|nr:hypothetical protein [Coxiellaceae bacterium]